jgi:hypothetical protein
MQGLHTVKRQHVQTASNQALADQRRFAGRKSELVLIGDQAEQYIRTVFRYL